MTEYVRREKPLALVVPTQVRVAEDMVPIWEKYLLTIEEACKYFNIGDTKMRDIAKEHADDSSIILMNGSKYLIKREAMRELLKKTGSI